MRRALVAADLVGITLAFVLAEALIGAGVSAGRVLFFAATLPAWVVAAKLYGLYDRDEERTDHSTADDFVGVFHMVTVGAWLLVARRVAARSIAHAAARRSSRSSGSLASCS